MQILDGAITPIEAYTPNANIAEHGVRELKRQYRKVMLATNSPECLWDCCMEHLADVIRDELGFTPCKADNDVWMRKATKPVTGEKYYEYLLVHTDDCLVVSHDPKAVLNSIDAHFKLKPGSDGHPEKYLGADIARYTIGDQEYWSMGSKQYVDEAISNVEKWLADRGMMYLKRKSAKSVLPSSYRPELDDTKYLDQEYVSYYQEQIGVLRWMVELGRVDICCEVSPMLAAYCAAPRKGHLEAVIHMFAYLKGHANLNLFSIQTQLFIQNLTHWIGQTFTRMPKTLCHLICQNLLENLSSAMYLLIQTMLETLLPGDQGQELLSLSTKLLSFGIARNREVLKHHLLVLSLWQ